MSPVPTNDEDGYNDYLIEEEEGINDPNVFGHRQQRQGQV